MRFGEETNQTGTGRWKDKYWLLRHSLPKIKCEQLGVPSISGQDMTTTKFHPLNIHPKIRPYSDEEIFSSEHFYLILSFLCTIIILYDKILLLKVPLPLTRQGGFAIDE